MNLRVGKTIALTVFQSFFWWIYWWFELEISFFFCFFVCFLSISSPIWSLDFFLSNVSVSPLIWQLSLKNITHTLYQGQCHLRLLLNFLKNLHKPHYDNFENLIFRPVKNKSISVYLKDPNNTLLLALNIIFLSSLCKRLIDDFVSQNLLCEIKGSF